MITGNDKAREQPEKSPERPSRLIVAILDAIGFGRLKGIFEWLDKRCPEKRQPWLYAGFAVFFATVAFFASLYFIKAYWGLNKLNWVIAFWISILVLQLCLYLFLEPEPYSRARQRSMIALGVFTWLAVALLLVWQPLTGMPVPGMPEDEGGIFQPPPPGIRNGDFGDGFTAWNTSQEGGLHEPRLDYDHYSDEEPGVVLGSRDLGDTQAEEIVPVGCSILSQEVHVPDTPEVALAFDWSMITYDIVCDAEERTMDSLDIFVEEGDDRTLIFREGNPCIGTSRQSHWMDWCREGDLSGGNWRRDVVSLATWRGKDIRLIFELCNRDAPNTQPDYDYYNSWAYIDNVEILEKGRPTQRCWMETSCDYGKCTPRMP
ncbi:MAG: hypothetical protein QXQ02_00705 [Halobacteria archaeon]